MRISTFQICAVAMALVLSNGYLLQAQAGLPVPPPIPTPAHRAEPVPDQIEMTGGRFKPTAESLTQYQCPDWFRDAKFGIWSHWGPQSVPMNDGWYARNMYIEGSEAYQYHLKHYGHPSVFGYKDIIQLWHAEHFNPDRLMKLYVQAGAKYFVAQGSHHDNFDNWDSKYHAWNSVNYGPQKDIVGLWRNAALKGGLRFGISEHVARSYSWLNPSHGADKEGPLKGVPYDGNDPKYIGLYWPANAETTEKYPVNPPLWVKKDWYYRMKDLEDKYHPDLLYSDGGIPFGDVGRMFLANYYNSNMNWNGGNLEAVYNIKNLQGHGEYIEGGCVQDLERSGLNSIKNAPWQTDTSTGPWFYKPGTQYSADQTIHSLVDIVSKNGNLLLNVTQKPDGSLDSGAEQMLIDMGAWMQKNGEAIFGTRPWTIFGEGPTTVNEGRPSDDIPFTASDIRFTRKGDILYATTLGLPKKQVVIRSLSSDSPLVQGQITKLTLLGYDGDLSTQRTPEGLSIQLPENLPLQAALCFKITGLITLSNVSPDTLSTFLAQLEKQTFKVEAAELVGGASRVIEDTGLGAYRVGLAQPGQAIRFAGMPAATKLAIRYGSISNGTISVAVNDQPEQRVNVHSSGALTNCVLRSIVNIRIPANALLTISLRTDDVAITLDQIIVGDGDLGLPPDIWNLRPLQVAAGPYTADWQDISRLYVTPEWWRDAKFGAWAHWDPQSMPEDGDWYARGMYQEGGAQYKYQLQHFGHPSVYGYKDIAHHWVVDRWNPNKLMDLYVEMGARYFIAMGAHHDNFDCFNSKYQPWNSVNVGPRVDIVGTWERAARERNLHFGIGFHDTPGRTWGQFMPVRYTSDKQGPMKGVPYDALRTVLDGKGEWWEGLDPVDLYGPPHTVAKGPRRPENDPLLSPFANQFMWRVDDAITRYQPDVIYFDEGAGDSNVDLGVHMGLGFLAPTLAANFYNKSLLWNHGQMKAVLNLKGLGGRYNSFQDHPELMPLVDRSLVKSTEAVIEPEIMAYSFQTETSISDWHYKIGEHSKDARTIVSLLMQNVSRNGTMLLNLTQHGRGDLDPEVFSICKDVGAWLKINGAAVYSSRPFAVCEENANTVCYTRNDGYVYAAVMNWNNHPITLKALHCSDTLGKVSKVEMLGFDVPLTFAEDDQGLTVTPSGVIPPLAGIANQSLAAMCRVLRITHDKGWFNDDDPGATYPGWIRQCNLGTGDFNNDLTISEKPGDVWSCSFTGSNVSVIAPKVMGAGKIEVQVDGQTRATGDESTNGPRLAQQSICKVTGLTPGKHTIEIVNCGPGPVAVDALTFQ